MDQVIDSLHDNGSVLSAIAKADEILHGPYRRILVSVSGGADSDVMVDLINLVGHNSDASVYYVFYDTGIEYAATHEQLDYLESRYNIKIYRFKASMTVPQAVKKYGQPFLSKQISNYIARLQKHDFQWEDLPFETLWQKYPRCKAALRWWCNNWPENSRTNISYYRQLKEYMIANPPTFSISDMCCTATKKRTAHCAYKSFTPDLTCTGVRRSEGGARSTAYHSCWTQHIENADEFRPLYWLSNKDRRDYESARNISHSICYDKYGLDRTGCPGCPFSKKYNNELQVLNQYEPKLYNLATNIFKESYEYTNNYIKWRNEHK